LSSIFILLSIKTRIETEDETRRTEEIAIFLSYYPLKQGLKQYFNDDIIVLADKIFILLSIKTRIETFQNIEKDKADKIFLSYYPLKQGLKRET